MVTRRSFLTRGSAGVLGLAGVSLAMPSDSGDPLPGTLPDGQASRGMMTTESEAAIARGLKYLAARYSEARRMGGTFGTRGYFGHVAVVSLAAMAYMSAGNQPDRGPYGKIISEALRFVLDQENRDGRYPGYLYNPRATPHGPMYGHGFGTLFLGEVYGMMHASGLKREQREKPIRELRDKLKLALQCIVKSQNVEGGWRYQPDSRDADLSVTVCQIMALRSARNAGFAVPKDTVTRCVNYVKRCQERNDGSFRYMVQNGGPRDPFARTAAGVSALYSAGVYSGPEVEAGLNYLTRNKPAGGGRTDPMQYFYGHYYAAQAMWTAGGKYWEEWFPAIREELVNQQQPDGSWHDGIDQHYATAMACIILQIPNNYLPILQK